MSEHEDSLRRAFARLTALKENLAKGGDVREEFVQEFHEALGHLERLKFSVEEFKIPEDHIRPSITSRSNFTGEVTYSRKRYVDKTYFMIKLDSVLGYFTFSYGERKPEVGFASR